MIRAGRRIARTGRRRRDGWIMRYLRHPHENILLLSDLLDVPAAAPIPAGQPHLDRATVRRGRLIAVQAFYRYGRWLPHFEDAAASGCHAARTRAEPPYAGSWACAGSSIRSSSGCTELGLSLGYDEHDYLLLCRSRIVLPCPLPGRPPRHRQRCGRPGRLRCRFEGEYFQRAGPAHRAAPGASRAAQRYVARRAPLSPSARARVSMVVVEASIPGSAHVGAVYTEQRPIAGRGLAKGVVSAICAGATCAPRNACAHRARRQRAGAARLSRPWAFAVARLSHGRLQRMGAASG